MDLTTSTPKPPATPVPERSLNRQVVLEEDEYTAALSQIIARDFFPSLVHLDATNGPSETPLRTPRGETPNKRPRYDTNLGLDDFQARYTSEDNSSFTHILDDENRKRKEQWGWAWEAQKKVEGQREKLLERRERMLIEAPPVTGVREKFVIEAPVVAGLITDGRESELQGESSNAEEQGGGGTLTEGKELSLVGKPPEVLEVDVLAPKKDTRRAGVDAWKFKTRNSLMFPPDADVSPYHPSAKATDAGGNPKYITHGSTRLPEQDDSPSQSRAMSAPPSPTRSRIDAAIAGTPYRPTSPTTNFSLVPNLPSPTPSELGPAAVKQLMTWGTLNATPRIISESDDSALAPPTTPFHLPSLSSRERISQKLSNNASKSLRAKAGLLGLGSLGRTPGIARTPTSVRGSAGRKGTMAPPAWTPQRADAADNLTPAARKLLDRSTMGTAAVRRAEAMNRIAGWEGSGKGTDTDLNRVRWTPTPSPVARRR